MKFFSTRGAGPVGFIDAVRSPLGEDGGLLLPERWPVVTPREIDMAKTYQALALMIVSKFANIPSKKLEELINRAYTKAAFGTDAIVPITLLRDDVHVVHVSNGPTWSFKDIALRFLAQLLEYLLEELDQRVVIVVATSGDTGSAVINSMRGMKRIKVVVLSPRGGSMSSLQRKQMYGVDEANVLNLAVEGSFDDCQDCAKAALGDPDLKKLGISGANSINFARILAQIVYYFEACKRMNASASRPATFVVPTGNSGNCTAADFARRMGAPIGRIIMATNENNVLHRFCQTAEYVKEEKIDTPSPSMDIQVSSNFERIIFEYFGRDEKLVRHLFGELRSKGSFSLVGHPLFAKFKRDFGSGFLTNDETIQSIRDVRNEHNIDVDPHTAVAFGVLKKLRAEIGDRGPIGIVETALPGKFADTMRLALRRDPDFPPGYEKILAAKEKATTVPADFNAVKEEILRFAA
ncbi:MAG: thrC [Candidatus Kaiserbacteria bacterium]|nr:thrC [Candidatus Kaiserbacteria bacterium]